MNFVKTTTEPIPAATKHNIFGSTIATAGNAISGAKSTGDQVAAENAHLAAEDGARRRKKRSSCKTSQDTQVCINNMPYLDVHNNDSNS